MIKLKLSPAIIEKILIEEDPEGLIGLGAPQDEYEHEANMIYNRIINDYAVDNEDRIFIKIVGVFFEQFGTSSNVYIGGVKSPDVKFDLDYFDNQFKLKRFKEIAKLIYKSIEKE